MAYYAPQPPAAPPPGGFGAAPPASGPNLAGGPATGGPVGGADVTDVPMRVLGLVGAGLVVLTAALPWLSGPGLPDGSGLATASRLWAVGGVLSDTLRLAAVLWIVIPLAGCALWALRWAVRGWSWLASFAVGLVTVGVTVAVMVTVGGANSGSLGVGIWVSLVGAVIGVVADLLHYVRTPRRTTA